MLERKQKDSSNPFRIRIFLFLSYSFGIETIKYAFIHSHSFLKTHIRFQTKLKIYSHFQTQKVQKPYLMGWHIPIWPKLGSTPTLAPTGTIFDSFKPLKW